MFNQLQGAVLKMTSKCSYVLGSIFLILNLQVCFCCQPQLQVTEPKAVKNGTERGRVTYNAANNDASEEDLELVPTEQTLQSTTTTAERTQHFTTKTSPLMSITQTANISVITLQNTANIPTQNNCNNNHCQINY